MKTTLELLTDFVNQKPGLDFADYGDSKSYNAESREITKDRTDFLELMNLFLMRLGDKANEKLTYNLLNSGGRLVLKENKKPSAMYPFYIEYTTGQYFPTEYRPAACRIIAQLIWNDYVNEPEANSPNPIYKDGHEIRKAISQRVSRRVMKNYFN